MSVAELFPSLFTSDHSLVYNKIMISDSGGPGEFKYDGGPKPYIKKSGEASQTEGGSTKPQGEPEAPQIPKVAIPQLTAEQQQRVDELAKMYGEHFRTEAESQERYQVEYQKKVLRQIKSGKDYQNFLGPELSEEQKDDILSYQSPDTRGSYGFKGLNNYLANGPGEGYTEKDNKGFQKTADDMSKVINTHKAIKDTTLYRTVTNPADFVDPEDRDESDNNGIKHIQELMNLKEGDIWTNKAFSSTTTSKKGFKSMSSSTPTGVKLEIAIKKGQPGLSVNRAIQEHSDYDDQEVLLDKDSKFRVDSIDKKTRHIKLSLLDKGAVDSLALDYTFIPEEHPRQNDPDWGGKGQDPNQSTSLTPQIPNIAIPQLPPEHQKRVDELTGKYSELLGTKVGSAETTSSIGSVARLTATFNKISNYISSVESETSTEGETPPEESSG